MTATVLEQPAPARAGTGGGGLPARRAVMRWALRMFRREWRQQLLMLGMLIIAVAATVIGAGVAANTPPPPAAGFGTATASVTIPGSDPHLAADISSLRSRYGAVDVIENQAISTGSSQQAYLRAQDPHGSYGQPMLKLDSGSYPAQADEVALTQGLSTLYNVQAGGTWHQDGHSYRVTGIVENPTNLLDEFALVAPSQLTSPAQVTVLLDAQPPGSGTGPGSNANRDTLPGLPQGAVAAFAGLSTGGSLSPAVIVLAISVMGMVFVGLVAAAGFTVIAQRRLRALGMISALGATERNVRLVTTANGAFVGVIAAVAGPAWAWPGGSSTRRTLARTPGTGSARCTCPGGRSASRWPSPWPHPSWRRGGRRKTWQGYRWSPPSPGGPASPAPCTARSCPACCSSAPASPACSFPAAGAALAAPTLCSCSAG